MVYTSRKRNFRRFVKTHNLKYYFAFLAMVLAIVAAVVVITRNNRSDKRPDVTDETLKTSDETSGSETDTEPEVVRGIYRLCLNLETGCMAAYEWDVESEKFSENAARYMLFAARNITAGDFSAPYTGTSKSAWESSERKDRFYRYATSFGGKLVFHSPDYDTQGDRNSLIVESYSAIGEPHPENLSDGITLTVADAKWIYENCSFESEISIYADKNERAPAPANRIIPIPDEIKWEPTDASHGTPWCQTEIEELTAPPVFELLLGAPVSVVLGSAKALDKSGTDVSEYIYISGEFDTDKAGVYSLTYNLIDIFGNHLQKPLKLTVKEPETTPEETTANPQTTPPEESTEDITSGTDETTSDYPSDSETTEPDESTPPSDESTKATENQNPEPPLPENTTSTEEEPAEETPLPV